MFNRDTTREIISLELAQILLMMILSKHCLHIIYIYLKTWKQEIYIQQPLGKYFTVFTLDLHRPYLDWPSISVLIPEAINNTFKLDLKWLPSEGLNLEFDVNLP